MSTNQLGEALTAAQVPALIQKVIDPLMLDYQRRYAPLVRVTPTKQWGSTIYNFNRRTSRAPGGFVTDGGARPVGASVFEQKNFTIRNMQSLGAVTGYAQEVTRSLIGDLQREEIEACAQGLLWDIETAMVWGNSGATVNGPYPQFDGLNTLVNQFTGTSTAPQNAKDMAGNDVTAGVLDQLIDMVQTNAAMPVGSNYMFVASPTAISRLAQHETPFQRFMGQTEVAAGLNVATYRDVPFIPSSFLATRWGTMSTVTTSSSATGGSMAAGTYYYVIVPVMARQGAFQPSAEVATTALTGSTSQVTLNFTPPTGLENSTPLHYEVYRGTSAGNETLLGIVDAVVGLQSDGINTFATTSIVDTGAALVPQNGSTVPAVLPTSYVGGSSMKPRVTAGEDIYLAPKTPEFLVRPFVRDIRPISVYPTVASPDSLPFALVSDTCLALRAEKYVGRLRNVVATLQN